MRVKYSSLFWVFSLLALNSFAQNEVPNPGPRTTQEATLLFTEGNQSLADKKYSDAIRDLEKLINRYPSFERIQDAYLSLLDALFAEKKQNDLIQYCKELLNLNPGKPEANRARLYESEALLNEHRYLDARLVADELLKNAPTSRQSAAAYSIKFQSFLEEKQYKEAHIQLDALDQAVEKEKLEPYPRLLPEFKMTLAVRECTISHLLKNKAFEESELTEYFKGKNLCFKSALPIAVNGMSDSAVQEWCESFTFLNHELESMKIDTDLKKKLNDDLKATFEFSKTISQGFYKCYEPYKPPRSPKSKKRHRKRRVPSS